MLCTKLILKDLISKAPIINPIYRSAFLSNPESDFIYIPIQKNAHTWTVNELLARGFTNKTFFHNPEYINAKDTIVVLRDPIERWISGMAEYFSIALWDMKLLDTSTDVIDEEMLEIIINKTELDQHTRSQTDFIKKINMNKLIFFNFHDNYTMRFRDFLNSRGLLQDGVNWAKLNSTDTKFRTPHKTLRWVTFFNEVLKNPQYLKKIQNFYEEDQKLIDSVKFYQ